MKSSLIAFVLLIALALPTSGAAAQAPKNGDSSVDPFYLNLLQLGTQALDRNDYPTAVHDLRIACFGLLDTPKLLAAGLVKLAIAQAGTENWQDFSTTFGRILQIENRFQAYSEADIPAKLESRFEQLALAHVPEQTLSSSPAFAPLVVEQQRRRLAALPPRQRRSELQALVAKNPDDPNWSVMLARLDLAEGKAALAAKTIDGVLVAHPGNSEALCLRGQIRAAGGDCASAEGDLLACAELDSDASIATAALGCMIANRHWTQAHQLLRNLPPAMAKNQGIVSLATTLVKAETVGQKQPAPRTSAATAHRNRKPAPDKESKSVTSASPTGSATHRSGAPGGPNNSEQETLQQARRIVDSAHKVSDLDHAMELIEPLTEAHPHDPTVQFLAAEIAYRSSHWHEAVKHFELGGVPPEDHPILRFYYAVSLYESGNRPRAAEVLRSCIGKLQRTPFVQRYASEILGPQGR